MFININNRPKCHLHITLLFHYDVMKSVHCTVYKLQCEIHDNSLDSTEL